MGLVLHGILNMPYPDDPADLDVVTWAHAKSAMREASAEIERLREVMEIQGKMLASGSAGHRGVIIGQRLLNAML